jgi:hypothetical protein
MIPRYSLELTHKAQNQFRFNVTRAGIAEDLSTWSNLWFAAKRRATDPDDRVIFEKVLFAGVEIIDAPTGLVEVTLEPTDGDDLTEGSRYNLHGDVGGTDGDLKVWQLFTLAITLYPRIRRSSF